MMPLVSCYTYVRECYPNWINVSDARLRKAIRDEEDAKESLKIRKMEVN